MGQTPMPFEPGEECFVCWGTGGPWEGLQTPKLVIIAFAGFTGALCIEANKSFIATQTESPCIWAYDDGTYHGFWAAAGPAQKLTCNRWDPPTTCIAFLGGDCQTHFEFEGITGDVT